jgi:spermidine/putrescine transport system permease protein
VIFPLSLGGVIAGATMTFCLSFGDFVAPVLVGGPDGTMVANLLQTQFGAALNWPLGSALATLVLALVLVLLQISTRLDRAGHIDLT